MALPGAIGPAVIALLCLAAAFGLPRTETDPSLLSYFAAGSELRSGLESIDSSSCRFWRPPPSDAAQDEHHAEDAAVAAMERRGAALHALCRPVAVDEPQVLAQH